MSQEIVVLEFGFKGGRDYIQGPDLVNEVIAHFSTESIKNIKFTIHDFIYKSCCTLTVYKNDPINLTGAFRGRVVVNGCMRWVEVTELEQQPAVVQRYSYNEELITSRCCIENEVVKLLEKSPYSFVETVVAMKKYLLSQLIPPGNNKWIFTSIELDDYSDLREELEIKMLHNFQNKLVKSEVLFGGERVGNIYFSLVKS